jgi:hypothetical protein
MVRAHQVLMHKGARFSTGRCTARFQAAMVLFALVTVGGCIAQGDDSALATIAHPHDVSQLKSAYTAILKGASPQRVRGLTKERSDGLAVAAAWRQAMNSCESGPPSETKAMCAFTRFVGFVDGRLPAEIPECWEQNVASAAWRNGYVTFLVDPKPPEEPFHGRRIAHVTKGWSIKVVETGCELSRRDTRVVVPSELIDRAMKTRAFPIFSPVVDGDAVFVVIAGDTPYDAADLAKFSRQTGKLLWTQKIWTGGELSGAGIGGPHVRMHVVEPKIGRDGNVYVFGISVFGAYINSFSAAEGTPRLRFSTLCLEW